MRIPGYNLDLAMGDFNGAVGIFLKAMWDTTFLDSVGDVVLSLSDSADVINVQDVTICPG
ncbi:MAG: hypothetical protein F6J94_00185 [Moorea sp. SIO1F2]|uniref:hypothetical protein n=1 Tax=Moorena sp. SIO1F2 TaxID=2607819 RepID=UPI0013B6A2CB|nr:hypothetical protein [Moorena sp. SIO1F2]NET80463.1 hypothetical protein [Moorena sp. SIO1F2]